MEGKRGKKMERKIKERKKQVEKIVDAFYLQKTLLMLANEQLHSPTKIQPEPDEQEPGLGVGLCLSLSPAELAMKIGSIED